eukprot:jgi/Mesvir1/2095/Mv16627-RA.1
MEASATEQDRPTDCSLLSEDIWLRIFELVGPDDVSKCAMECRAWRQFGQNQELWKRRLSAVLGKELVREFEDRVANIDWVALARVFLWCPAKRSVITPLRDYTPGAAPHPAGQPPHSGEGAVQEGRVVQERSNSWGQCVFPAQPAQHIDPAMPECLDGKVAPYTDAALDHMRELRGLALCSIVHKLTWIDLQGQLEGIEDPTEGVLLLEQRIGQMTISEPLRAGTSTAGSSLPGAATLVTDAVSTGTDCVAIMGATCGCFPMRDGMHYRGMLLELPEGFAELVADSDPSSGRGPPWGSLRCPWCAALAIYVRLRSADVTRFVNKWDLDFYNDLALVCSQNVAQHASYIVIKVIVTY